MRWPWFRRHSPQQAAALEFDVSIDIGQHGAAEEVQSRVLDIPGAGWVSVETHAGLPLSIRLYEPGLNVERDGEQWRVLRGRVEEAVRGAMAAAGFGPSTGWSVAQEMPFGMRPGFAETHAPFEALEKLAAFARQSQPPPAQPTPEPPRAIAAPAPMAVAAEDREDVGRLARLLALVLPEGAAAAAAAAVQRLGSYAAVLAAPEAELRGVAGLGTHSIAAIKLVHAAAIRFARAGITDRPVLADRQRLNDYLATALGRERVEQFRILFLDEKGMLRADEVQAQGTVNHTPVYPREVVRRALALQAASLVLVHNHPSGDPAPSRDDVEMTKQVREAAAIMQIGLRDHVIVGNGRWLSFRDEGYLDG